MDTSPFANNRNQGNDMDDYLKPTQGGAGMAGAVNGVSNMVKALMAGDQKFRQQGGMAGAPNPTTTTGGPSVGQPMSLAPPAPGPSADVAQDRAAGAATSMVGGGSAGPMPMAPSPFDVGTSPVVNGGPFGGAGMPMGMTGPTSDMSMGGGGMSFGLPKSNNPWSMGAAPLSGMDPVSRALMSPIPGV